MPFGLTAGQAGAVATAAYLWQVIGAARTFARRPQDRSPLSPLFGLGFAALIFDSWNAVPTPGLFVAGCAGLAAALALFEWARRTIRGLYFSYIFSTDLPTFLCRSGPYAYIRNPFYASYLLTMASTALMRPSLFSGGVVLAMVGLPTWRPFKRSGSSLEAACRRNTHRTQRELDASSPR
jgi:protein-S-isoprenylcysteine O-methyltransferase Ste14